jgi:hypothetical protein
MKTDAIWIALYSVRTGMKIFSHPMALSDSGPGSNPIKNFSKKYLQNPESVPLLPDLPK